MADVVEGYGVDRLSVAFPVRSFERDPDAWTGGMLSRPGDGGSTSWSGSVKLAAGGPAVFVGVRHINATGMTWGKLEYNPARVVDPEGVALCPVVELGSTLAAAAAASGELVERSCDVEDMRVRRVDLARDFVQVDSASFYVAGLQHVRRPWARQSSVYNDPGHGGAETLRVGSGSGCVRLYDKHQESPTKAASGSLRWEAECRRGWAERYGGVAGVSDLTEHKLRRLARDRWEWSSMGVEVAGTDRVIEKIQRAGHRDDCPKGCEDHLSPAEQRGFLGYLMMTGRGWPTKVSHRTGAKYGRIARELAIACSSDVAAVASADAITGRLDWESGREVLKVA